MKKILSFVLAVLLSMGAGYACQKKRSEAPKAISPLTLIVMDTTQALIDGAQVKIGKAVYTTSYDGRVVLKPEVIGKERSLTITHKRYQKAEVVLDGSALSIVTLKPNPRKPMPEDEEAYPVMGGRTAGVRYEKMALSATPMMADMKSVTADYAVAEDMPEISERSVVPGHESLANNVAAGMLTAGEVNDFTKWYFWPTVIDSTHKQFVQTWQIAPRHRYTVQVVNKNGYPIASRAVSLSDNSGNTIFQGMTDNTGKAELWYQLIGNNLCGKHADFQIHVDDQIITAKDWHEGLNTVVLDEVCEANDDVDVMFVFDVTGSMGDELRYLQAEMKDVISRATNATGGLKIRTGAVVYRDHGDEYITRISRLTEDIKTTQAFIDNQQANGGGDYPEAIPEALMAALNSAGWNSEARARIAFLVLDAPCHQDSATLALLHDQILNAAAMGVRIVPVVCSGLGESGEYLLRSMAMATNGTSFFLTDDSGIGNPHLKPTTDSLKVEHLNDMLVRTIVEFSYMPDCTGQWNEEEINRIEEAFVPNPFKAEELASDPSIPHGPTTLYLLDISGKLITIYNGELEKAGDAQLSSLGIRLTTGVYFVKAFYEGQWHTKKILVH